MDAARWDRLEELLEQAVALPPDERPAFIDRACGDDAALRAELASLLAAAEGAPGFFDDLGVGIPSLDMPDNVLPADLPANVHVGPYRLIELIGRGGMGRVFLAEREDVGQRVALKLVRGGLAAPDAVQRFLFERRVLARLEHPHIAHFLDAGMTEDETPFFAMEYVEGETITTYCDRRRLPIDERLRLFEQVAEAVQYAHRNLIVHRDLKPSNILVKDDGTVKLLDFGIAKLLEEDATDVPMTRTGFRVLTPEYAAPEQVTGDAVTTTTDVYSLGVVLYELLTGHRPYTLPRSSPGAIERAIVEAEPERPSTAVSHTSEHHHPDGTSEMVTPEAVSEARSTQADRLRQRLAGDLDMIVLKALRKEPEQRYASAEAFVEDIRRHLEGLPVSARPLTPGYRLRSFIRRNRAAVTAGAFVVLALALGLALALWQARRAQHERDTAQQVSTLLEELLAASDPIAPTAERLDTLRVQDLLDRSALTVRQELEDRPEIQAQMLHILGRVNQNLGRYDEAEPLLNDALALRLRYLGDRHEETARTKQELAKLHHALGNYEEATRLRRQVVEAARRLDGATSAWYAYTLNDLGITLLQVGEYDEAARLYAEAVAIFRLAGVEDSTEYAEVLNNYAVLRHQQDSLAHAETLLREALGIMRRHLGPEHPQVGITVNTLGSTVQFSGRQAEAVPLFEEAYEILFGAYGELHPQVSLVIQNLATLYDDLGRYTLADSLYRRSLAIDRQIIGPRHADVAITLRNLALLHDVLGDYAEAEILLREAVSIFEEQLPEGHPYTIVTAGSLGKVLTARGNLDEAEPLLRTAMEKLPEVFPADHRFVLGSRRDWGAYLVARGRYDEAEPLLLDTYEQLNNAFGTQSYSTYETARQLVYLYERMDRPEQAARFAALLPENATR